MKEEIFYFKVITNPYDRFRSDVQITNLPGDWSQVPDLARIAASLFLAKRIGYAVVARHKDHVHVNPKEDYLSRALKSVNCFRVGMTTTFEMLLEEVTSRMPENDSTRKKVIHVIYEIYQRLSHNRGFQLPSSFYRSMLDPVLRNSVTEKVHLALDEKYKESAAELDAATHALGKVTTLALAVHLHTMKYGFYLDHKCSCDHGIYEIEHGTTLNTPDFFEKVSLKDIFSYYWHFLWELSEYSLYPQTNYMAKPDYDAPFSPLAIMSKEIA